MSLDEEMLIIVGENWGKLPFLGRTRAPVPVPRMGTGTHGAFWYRREVVPIPLKVVPVPEDIFGPKGKWYRYTLAVDDWYRYLKTFLVQKGSGTDTRWQWMTGTGTSQSGTGTTASCNLKLEYFAPLSPVLIHRLFRNP